ncbi:hypothetical protein T265_03647 [Opisthorchis viverrini]|uniref:Uncharacterized protein n=1 Tax=Opisthorchis viverrini TaxID=6198 RepID=A0A075A2I0_OPIVI|nr:hypothetical protein T265_03647 [Opisthorchis viverrini]KER29735.1 hypothetical protein T265_03647 [Opisthorchis viverrini]
MNPKIPQPHVFARRKSEQDIAVLFITSSPTALQIGLLTERNCKRTASGSTRIPTINAKAVDPVIRTRG